MTINEALDKLDLVCPNNVARDLKISWLSTLDTMIYKELLKPWGLSGESFRGYDETTDGNQRLLADTPYQDMYLYYMEREIALIHREINRYNDAAALYHDLFGRLQCAIARTSLWPEEVRLQV